MNQESQIADAARYAVSHAAVRMIKRTGHQAIQAAKRGPDEFAAWLAGFDSQNGTVVASEFSTAERIVTAVYPSFRISQHVIAETFSELVKKSWGTLDTSVPFPGRAAPGLFAQQMLEIPDRLVHIFTGSE